MIRLGQNNFIIGKNNHSGGVAARISTGTHKTGISTGISAVRDSTHKTWLFT
jgi:hypothetical protein